jgi:hypothetical protein
VGKAEINKRLEIVGMGFLQVVELVPDPILAFLIFEGYQVLLLEKWKRLKSVQGD